MPSSFRHACLRTCLLVVAAQPLAALANSFCCDTNGQTYCDYGLPRACYGKAYRELNDSGRIVKQYAAPLTAEQKAQREAELARQREAEAKREEQESQDRKLLSTYVTLSDLDDGHTQMLEDMQAGQKQLEQKLAAAEKQKQQLANEAEFYQKHKLPAALKAKMDANQKDIDGQKQAIETRKQEIVTAKARFDEERQRYLRLTAGIAERQR